MNYLERLKTLARFIRNQAGLDDVHPHPEGKGHVKLSYEEAMLCAVALDGLVRQLSADG